MVFISVFNIISCISQLPVYISMHSCSSFNQYSALYSSQATGCFTSFHVYRSGQCTYPCIPAVVLISSLHNIPPKPLAACQHNIVETMNSSERGMNLGAMTIHQSSEKLLADPGIEPATSCSQILHATD